MSKTSRSDSEDSATEAIARAIGLSAIQSGAIDPKGLSHGELVDAIAEYINTLVLDGVEIEVVLDHQEDLLGQARAFVEEEKLDFALIFYSAWVEHWLNRMLVWKSTSLEKRGAAVRDHLLKLNLQDKLAVAWSILFPEPLDAVLVREIKSLADARNTFLHYKWKPFNPSSPPSHADLVSKRELIEVAETIIDRLTIYRAEHVFGGAEKALWIEEFGTKSLSVRPKGSY